MLHIQRWMPYSLGHGFWLHSSSLVSGLEVLSHRVSEASDWSWLLTQTGTEVLLPSQKYTQIQKHILIQINLNSIFMISRNRILITCCSFYLCHKFLSRVTRNVSRYKKSLLPILKCFLESCTHNRFLYCVLAILSGKKNHPA